MGFSEKKRAVAQAFSSREAFVKAVETRTDVGDGETERTRWKNEDLDVSPPENRTWTYFDYAGFWAAYGVSPGTWSVGSALIAVGLKPWQAVICLFFG